MRDQGTYMKQPICRICLANEVVRIAKTIEMPDRGFLVSAAADIRQRRGCVHLAVPGSGPVEGIWCWTACGKRGDYYSTCTNPEHVVCELCQSKQAFRDVCSGKVPDHGSPGPLVSEEDPR